MFCRRGWMDDCVIFKSTLRSYLNNKFIKYSETCGFIKSYNGIRWIYAVAFIYDHDRDYTSSLKPPFHILKWLKVERILSVLIITMKFYIFTWELALPCLHIILFVTCIVSNIVCEKWYDSEDCKMVSHFFVYLKSICKYQRKTITYSYCKLNYFVWIFLYTTFYLKY